MGHFDDVEDELGKINGVLDSDALRNQERIIEKLNPQGIGYDFHANCQNCNRQNSVTLTWPEIIVASAGLLPVDEHSRRPWIAGRGAMFPPIGCAACGEQLLVPVTPDKAERYLRAGMAAKFLTPEQVNSGRMSAMQRAKAMQHAR
jgi:hypothetical protein